MSDIPFNKAGTIGKEAAYIREAIRTHHLAADGPTRRVWKEVDDHTVKTRRAAGHPPAEERELRSAVDLFSRSGAVREGPVRRLLVGGRR